MPAQVLTNVDLGSIGLEGEVHRDELITFAGAATLLAGCIMARDSVSLKLVPFVKGGATNQNGIPKAVLTYPVTATGAGDLKERVLVSGKVNKTRLVINADGTGVNIDGAVLDQLRAYDIVPVDVQQLST